MKRSREACCACLIVSSVVWSQPSASYLFAHSTTSWKYLRSFDRSRFLTSIIDSRRIGFHSSVLHALAWLMYVPVDIAKSSINGEILISLAPLRSNKRPQQQRRSHRLQSVSSNNLLQEKLPILTHPGCSLVNRERW